MVNRELELSHLSHDLRLTELTGRMNLQCRLNGTLRFGIKITSKFAHIADRNGWFICRVKTYVSIKPMIPSEGGRTCPILSKAQRVKVRQRTTQVEFSQLFKWEVLKRAFRRLEGRRYYAALLFKMSCSEKVSICGEAGSKYTAGISECLLQKSGPHLRCQIILTTMCSLLQLTFLSGSLCAGGFTIGFVLSNCTLALSIN